MLFNIAHFNALVALLAALSLPFARAHPFDRDISSVSLERTANVSARADNEPPDYSEAPDEELPGYSEEPPEGSPPEYVVNIGGEIVLKSVKVDEDKMTATDNKGKVYRLVPNPAELGAPDKNGLNRRYYMIDDTPEIGEEPVRVAVLKIVDLLKANKFHNKSVPKILQEEGYFWGKLRLFMWHKTIKQVDKHHKLKRWEYHVVYTALRNGLDLNEFQETLYGEQEATLRALKTVHEWSIEQQWTPANVEERLAQCKATAKKTHKEYAEIGFGITNVSPKMWLTDADCELWIPNQMDPSYTYVNRHTKALINVRGAMKLKDGKAKDKYLKDVKHRLKEVFTVESLQKQGDTFVHMEHEIAEGNLDGYM